MVYYTQNFCQMKDGKEGPEQLTNFTCRIEKELIYHDGPKHTTFLEISGTLSDPAEAGSGDEAKGITLPTITIPATDFAALSWIAEKWGMRPIVFPVGGAERDLRTAIQQASTPKEQHIYTHTGWTLIGKTPTYLSGTGGINQHKLDPTLLVSLPSELSRFQLPGPVQSKDAFTNSLRLVNIGPPSIMWPLLLATYRSAVGGSDFAMHLAGRTGTFKTELASLLQSHFGVEMDARHMPASWSSTANALEALAYKAKDALLVVDDFVPVGTSWQVRQLQKSADQLIRGQGNQAGRSRLTDSSSMQTTFFPRGLILSTGEDVPEQHSIRARMLILELAPGDVAAAKLTQGQEVRPSYPQAMSDWIQWLAATNAKETLGHLSRRFRDQYLDLGHSRTPPIMGDLMATMQLIVEYAVERGYFGMETMLDIQQKAQKAILEAGQRQREYLEAADPVTAMMETIRLMLSSGIAHLKTINGGVPEDPVSYGWTEQKAEGQITTYKSNGPRMGWVDVHDGEMLLDPGSLVLLKKYSGGKLAVTVQTLLKRLKEAGVLTRVDDTRQRNTVRVTLEGHPRNVISLNLKDVFEE